MKRKCQNVKNKNSALTIYYSNFANINLQTNKKKSKQVYARKIFARLSKPVFAYE